MIKKKTLKMVQMAILIAVLLVMAFTPLGYLRVGMLSISFLPIPVAIGAMLIGPGAGAVLGAVFGLTSFAQCFGTDAFGTTLMLINPFLTFLTCVPTRALAGYCVGLLFRVIYPRDKTKTVSFFIGGALGAVLNTFFFMSVLVLCFWHTEYIQELNKSMGGHGVITFVLLFIGVNFVFETVAACAAGGVITKAVSKAVGRSSS